MPLVQISKGFHPIHTCLTVSRFELTLEESNSLRSQTGTLKRGEHAKYIPKEFCEQGVAMLSSVLNSTRAINVNIQIIRIFTCIRQMLVDNTE